MVYSYEPTRIGETENSLGSPVPQGEAENRGQQEKKHSWEKRLAVKNILEFQGKVCRTYWESGEIINSSKISKAMHS